MPAKETPAYQSATYGELSRFYDAVFAPVLGRRVRGTIASLDLPPGAQVLEVGVGTGISLAAYPQHVDVTAIDLAPEMLAIAREKARCHGWRHIHVRQMDALCMDFPDDRFDYVLAFHILSVVPDAERLIREMLRVCRPGGTVVVVNHFRSEKRWLAALVDRLDPLTRRLGWRTTLRYSELIDGMPLRVERRFKTARRSLFTVVVAQKVEPASPDPLPPARILPDAACRRRAPVVAANRRTA
jgi:phosphatidylethanolamine/phosphatidyl-N-methylethanolamine N-methyltransferase